MYIAAGLAVKSHPDPLHFTLHRAVRAPAAAMLERERRAVRRPGAFEEAAPPPHDDEGEDASEGSGGTKRRRRGTKDSGVPGFICCACRKLSKALSGVLYMYVCIARSGRHGRGLGAKTRVGRLLCTLRPGLPVSAPIDHKSTRPDQQNNMATAGTRLDAVPVRQGAPERSGARPVVRYVVLSYVPFKIKI